MARSLQDYRCLSVFTLDDTVGVFVTQEEIPSVDKQNNVHEEQADGPSCTEDLPSRKRGMSVLKAATVVCREKLSNLVKATYLCQDPEALQHMSTMLDEAQSVHISTTRMPFTSPRRYP